MDFFGSVRSVISFPGNWGVISAIIVATMSAIFIWRRTRSTYSLMAKLWRLFHGKKECVEGPIRDFLDQQSALMQFRFITGVPVRTMKLARALIDWTEKNNEDMGDVAACGHYFDLDSIQLKKEPAKRKVSLFLFVAAVLLFAASAALLFGAIVDRAMLQMKQSQVYFTLSIDYAKPIGSDEGLSRDQCISGKSVTSSGFSPEDASIICNIFKENSVAPYVAKTVKEQRVTFAPLSLLFAWYFWCVLTWLKQGVKSREMFRRLLPKPLQNEQLELVADLATTTNLS